MRIKSVILIVFSYTLLLACSFQPAPSTPIFQIVSFREYFDRILESAKSWDKDAYIFLVDIPIKYNDRYLIDVEARSPNKDDESVAISVLEDGSLSQQIIPFEVEVYQFPPIDATDWSIDSPGAFELLASRQDLDLLRSADIYAEFCSRLTLERNRLRLEQVVWVLTISDCSGASFRFLDASTGEVLGDNLYDTK